MISLMFSFFWFHNVCGKGKVEKPVSNLPSFFMLYKEQDHAIKYGKW